MSSLAQKPSADASQDVSILTVDYRLTLAQMSAAGRYDWENNNITAEQFPLAGAGIVTFEAILFHFDRLISSDYAVKAIEPNGWQLAKIEHLLAFGATYPDEQRKYPIVALGSFALARDYCRRVPYLYRDGSRRDLGLLLWNGIWNDDCRFLAVRTLPSAA